MIKATKPNLIKLENRGTPAISENIWTWVLLRWIGYGLFLLSVLDVISLLIPLRLTNPAWEFQTMGNLVERVAVPLLALVMIFAGKETKRIRAEKWLLKALSWLTLFLGLFYFITIPLGIVNTIRLERQASQQIKAQVEQQINQFQGIQTVLNQTQTSAEMEQLLNQLGASQLLESNVPLSDLKKRTASAIAEDTKKLKAQAQTVQSAQRLELLKNSLKWNLGALIAGSLFFIIWRATRPWTRSL